ncbi:hypothetical protein [Flavobacterium sp.]|uniref:hypothetical protein n=1 Tax=Flavobacterium sp. TaxID=239 RepID=UPI003F6A3655
MKFLSKYLILLITIIGLTTSAQTQLQSLDAETKQFVTWNLVRENSSEPINTDGSQYFVEAFMVAKLKGLDSIMYMRFNAAKDKIEIKKGETSFSLTPIDSIEVNFQVTNKTYRYLKYKLDELDKKGYLVCNTNNKNVNFYKKEVITYVPLKVANNPYSSDIPAHYRKDDDLYFIGYDSKIIEFPKKSKDLINLFPDKENEIKKHIKENKLSLKKEEDILNIVSFLDKL